MSALLHEDLGGSSSTGRPVLVDVKQGLPVTCELTLVSVRLGPLFGVPHSVGAMDLGIIVQEGDPASFADPTHPYTRALLSSLPVPDPDVRRERFALKGEIPTPTAVHVGCRLRACCPLAKAVLPSPSRDGKSRQLITSSAIWPDRRKHESNEARLIRPRPALARPSSCRSADRPAHPPPLGVIACVVKDRTRGLVRSLAAGSAKRQGKPFLHHLSAGSAA
ncbi:oligopeptide/dipeptide ABC transporter ATP-binding protein [Bradyrhizobium sp. i1.15.2]|uniref:oligopeptide/dipeptide ABC transporter ATP-binding protein n=1 Tax=Bradyrhizobium sp. i1.15.2 TaxID=3156362 RepID=UPI003394E6A3